MSFTIQQIADAAYPDRRANTLKVKAALAEGLFDNNDLRSIISYIAKCDEDENEARHCDNFILDYNKPMVLRWYLFVNRLPATDKNLCLVNNVNPKLWAKHEGKWVRVVMASRMGDVGITEKLDAEYGYSKRVEVNALTDFTDRRPR